MSGPDPLDFGWWLASRASGVVALLCIAVSVGVGLAMAGRVGRRPTLARQLLAVHQQTALVGMVAIAVHGICLLGDEHLDPGVQDIAVPFLLDHARTWTALGVLAFWLAVVLGLSFWLRDRIGPQRWRALHRATLLVYVLSVAHTLGSGTDAGEPWLRLIVLATAAPVLFLLVVRLLPAAPATTPGFRRLKVVARVQESATVTSLHLEPADRRPLPDARPGQSVAVRAAGQVRSYSLSSAPGPRRWRISVKREPRGTVSRHLHDRVEVGDVLEVGAPAGTFTLPEGETPVVLISAGVGATPLLAMLHALARERSPREVVWLHTTRSPAGHAFGEEALELVRRLPRARHHVHLTQDAGRLTAADVQAFLPPDADVLVCGPVAFADALRDGLDLPPGRFHSESFGGGARARPPEVAFARSGVTVDWDDRFASLLELAEAHDVPAASSCRTGACQSCRATLTAGRVEHEPHAAVPSGSSALLCCARPEGDVVLDV